MLHYELRRLGLVTASQRQAAVPILRPYLGPGVGVKRRCPVFPCSANGTIEILKPHVGRVRIVEETSVDPATPVSVLLQLLVSNVRPAQKICTVEIAHRDVMRF